MALDNGYPMAAPTLPTPTDTPYDNSSKGTSAQSSRQSSSSPFSDFSPAPFTLGEDTMFTGQKGAIDTSENNRYSVRDPRRLTPDLSISLVSQIHTLKKELEGRDAMIGSLEETLHQTRMENEQLTEDLKAQRIEVKSVKSQMSLLEHNMLQELENTAKERDDAIESAADTKNLLEASKKKVRALEDKAKGTHIHWENEKQEWYSNKRKMESKIHVAEERLKTVVAEMMAVHSTVQNRPGTAHDADEGMPETWPVRGNDIRTASRLSNRSIDEPYENKGDMNFRVSRLSGLHEMGGSKMSGLSLADELEMTEDEENNAEHYEHEIYSPDALPEEIAMSSRRYSEDQKARKIMGFLADDHEKPFGDHITGQEHGGIIADYINLPGKCPPIAYADAGTQSTPPPTPAIQPKPTDSVTEKPAEQIERSANQSRKRVAIPSIILEQPSIPKSEIYTDRFLVSTSCQTDESPQHELSSKKIANEVARSAAAVTHEMRSSSTQTIEDISMGSIPASTRISPAPLTVPVIAIHPPASRPPSSHNNVVLPPRTRNAGCQAVIDIPKNLTSTAMQTQEIWIDKRPVKIPPRLQSSSLAIKPSSRPAERRTRTAKSIPSGSPRRKARNPPPVVADGVEASASGASKGNPRNPSPKREIEQQSRPALPQFGHTYPGISGHESINDKHGSGSGRAARSEDIFGDFDAIREDVKAGIADDFSDDDDEFANAEPIRKTLSKVQNSWKLVPQSQSTALDKSGSPFEEVKVQKAIDDPETTDPTAKDVSQSKSKTFQTNPIEGYRKGSSASKPPDIRRQALVSSGIAEHTQRARSPSVPGGFGKESPVVAPPFPVPTRSSSRKIPISTSDGAASPTPYTTSFFTARRGQDHARPPIKRRILRKVQSAAAVPKAPGRRPPPPPPSMSASSTVPGSSKPLPQPRNRFILPYDEVAELPSDVTPMPQSGSHAGEASIEAPRQQTSVVDAIAQTMVGEWMWKYVRKRTSFGITENPHTEFEMGRNGETANSSGIRHKRWVWLAPYDNAVIWSGKQPNSGPALLGKGGRKLMIQSVLDVKDDTPLPKNAGSQKAFDRSILILTPQRALRFTAVSRERHYIWLTALSFLSHSTRGMDDLASPPPLPQEEYQPPPSQETNVTFRRTSVRDSIRIAKARSRPSLGAHSFSSPIGEAEQKIIQDTKMAWEDKGIESDDAAEPPQVPRVATHARKRSSTGPRPVPLSAFHSYPANGTATASSFSLQAPTSRDKYDRFIPGSRGASASGPPTTETTMTCRSMNPNQDSYIAPPPVVPDNFFEPAGTMRMEAFIVGHGENEPLERSRTEPAKAKRETRSYRTRQGRKKDLRYWGVAESAEGGGAEGARTRDDPFTGF